MADKKNVVYGLHFDNKLIDSDTMRQYIKNYGYYRRPPKKIYYRMCDAKKALKLLPKEIQEKVTIVEYAPSLELNNSIDNIANRLFEFSDLVERFMSEGDNILLDRVLSEIKKIKLFHLSYIGQQQKDE